MLYWIGIEILALNARISYVPGGYCIMRVTMDNALDFAQGGLLYSSGRILIIHQGALGDFILTLPAITALREALAPGFLELMGQPWVLPLAHCPQYADRISDINRADMAIFFNEEATLPKKLCRDLGGFDAAFVFGNSETLAHNLRRAGIKNTFVLPPFPKLRMHVTDHHQRSLAEVGIFATLSPPRVFLREDEKKWAQDLVFSNGWRDKEIIVIHPGAGSRKKVWPPSRFATLGRMLAGDSRRLLLIQGPADYKTAPEALTGLHGVPCEIIHGLPVTRLAAVLSLASLFVGNDSGVSHLAAALGVPTVAIFGPTDPIVWAPKGRHSSWLRGDAGCGPCDRKTQHTCQSQQCLEKLSVEDVLAFIGAKISG